MFQAGSWCHNVYCYLYRLKEKFKPRYRHTHTHTTHKVQHCPALDKNSAAMSVWLGQSVPEVMHKVRRACIYAFPVVVYGCGVVLDAS